MSAEPAALEVRFEALTPQRLDVVLATEQQAYAHPWSRSNFLDSLQSGYQMQLLMAGDTCLLYTSPSPRDRTRSRMPSSA